MIFFATFFYLFSLFPHSPFIEHSTIRVHYVSGGYEDYNNVIAVDVVDAQYVDLGEYSYQSLTIRLHFVGGTDVLLHNVKYFEELGR